MRKPESHLIVAGVTQCFLLYFFSGFFTSKDDMPVYWVWLTILCPRYYTVAALFRITLEEYFIPCEDANATASANATYSDDTLCRKSTGRPRAEPRAQCLEHACVRTVRSMLQLRSGWQLCATTPPSLLPPPSRNLSMGDGRRLSHLMEDRGSNVTEREMCEYNAGGLLR